MKTKMINKDRISELSLDELTMILDMFDKNDKTIILNDENYKVKAPQNCYDTNYSVYDKNNNITYLIDIEDVHNINDHSIDELIQLSWKNK